MPLTAKQEEMRDQVVNMLIGSMKIADWETSQKALGIFVNDLVRDADEEDQKELVKFLIAKIDKQKDEKQLPNQMVITAGITSGLIPKPIADCFNAIYPSMFAKRAEMGERVTKLLAVITQEPGEEKKARKSIFKKG